MKKSDFVDVICWQEPKVGTHMVTAKTADGTEHQMTLHEFEQLPT